MNYRNSVGINTVLSNFETSFSGSSMPFASKSNADRYLGAFSYRFIGGSIWANAERVVQWPICSCQARPERLPEVRSLLTNRESKGHMAPVFPSNQSE